MIDLSKQKYTLYPIKLEDGTILKLKPPTQKLFQELVELQNDIENIGDNSVEVISYIYKMMTGIFNRNVDGRTFTIDQIEDMLDLQLCMLVFKDYLDTTVKALKK